MEKILILHQVLKKVKSSQLSGLKELLVNITSIKDEPEKPGAVYILWEN
jgi:hypothetical protein